MEATLELAGDVDAQALEAFLRRLAEVDPKVERLEIQLGQAEIEGPAEVARLTQALRAAGRRHQRVRLIQPPQVLAHTLYRVGALEAARFELFEPREELGSAG